MSVNRELVIRGARSRRPFPDRWNTGIVLLLDLLGTGRLDEVGERLRVYRQGGYAGIDGFVFLLLFFASDIGGGLKGFSAKIGEFNRRLAAVADRVRLPSQAAMSRLLAAVTPEAVRSLTKWLLREGAEVVEILRHPSMMTVDAVGESWHVLHYDPTKEALRQRALPEGPDLPEPRRRAAGFAAPGHSGRKRGEVQVSRSALQHAGSSIWLDSRVAPGNGERRPALRSAIGAAVELCSALDHPLHRVVMVEDGEFGDVPSLTEHRDAGVACITRLNRLGLLDQPEVRQHMATQPWYWVPDSRSGPRRSAMDLGEVTVRPGKRTVRDDGVPYEPITVRVIVTRYPREGEAEHGRVIEGWQYELFVALDLEPEAWPASDVVAAFYGRGAIENRFAQEDREVRLDHIYSYNLAGQELACVVGLFVWNLQVVNGFRLNPLPEERVPAPVRAVEIDPRPVPPAFLGQPEAAEPLVGEVQAAEAAEPLVGKVQVADTHADEQAQAALDTALRGLEWEHLLRKRPGWSFDTAKAVVRCPAEQSLLLTSADGRSGQRTHRLQFRAASGSCLCPMRASCFASQDPNASKMITIHVPKEAGVELEALLPPVHFARRRAQSAVNLTAPLPSGRPRAAIGPPLEAHLLAGPPPQGSAEISDAQFLPAVARTAFRRACDDLVIDVTVRAPAPAVRHPYLVTNPADRQHRRATWAQRNAWNTFSDKAEVHIAIDGCASVEAAFAWARSDRKSA